MIKKLSFLPLELGKFFKSFFSNRFYIPQSLHFITNYEKKTKKQKILISTFMKNLKEELLIEQQSLGWTK